MKTITYVNDVTKHDITLREPRFERFEGFPCLVGIDSSGREKWLEIRSESQFQQGLESGFINAPVRL
jgi:hypothetical protein